MLVVLQSWCATFSKKEKKKKSTSIKVSLIPHKTLCHTSHSIASFTWKANVDFSLLCDVIRRVGQWRVATLFDWHPIQTALSHVWLLSRCLCSLASSTQPQTPPVASPAPQDMCSHTCMLAMRVALMHHTDREMIQLLGDDIKYLHKRAVFEEISDKFANNFLQTVTFESYGDNS